VLVRCWRGGRARRPPGIVGWRRTPRRVGW
jgi:hypothetical protein